MTGNTFVEYFPQPQAFAVTGGGAYCEGGDGVAIGLSGSQTNVLYQLKLNGENFGDAIAGTGAALSFGLQTEEGLYSVIAYFGEMTCPAYMDDTVMVNSVAMPVQQQVLGGGGFCPEDDGVFIWLSGSESNYMYQLLLEDTPIGSMIQGNGEALVFAPQNVTGNYSVVAYEAELNCYGEMLGSVSVYQNESPAEFVLQGGGAYCEGGSGLELTLSGSETGVLYRVNRNGAYIGTSIAGTGSPLYLGTYTTSGTYTVAAINSQTLCYNVMSGSVTIGITPLQAPVAISPSAGSQNISVNPTTFYWNGSTCATSYRLKISLNQNLLNPIVDTVFSSDIAQPINITSLLPNQTYYWQIAAINGSVIRYSAVNSFSTVIVMDTQDVQIYTGWNQISSYINPSSTSIESIFSDIEENILIVKSPSGQYWLPSEGGTLTDWEYLKGYQLYSTVECTLTMEGTAVSQNTPIPMLTAGWYKISYLPHQAMPASEALSTIITGTLLVKDGRGGLYWPYFDVNTLENNAGTMVPGKGYDIYIITPRILIYPSMARTGDYPRGSLELEPKKLKSENCSGSGSAVLAFIAENLPDSSEIGIYDLNDELLASAVIKNGRAVATIWNGCLLESNVVNSNKLILKAYSPKDNSFIDFDIFDIHELTSNSHGKDIEYRDGAIYVVTEAKAATMPFISASPNPIENMADINYSTNESGYLTIEVISLDGRRLKTLADGYVDRGEYTLSADLSDLTSGVYQLIMKHHGSAATCQLIICK